MVYLLLIFVLYNPIQIGQFMRTFTRLILLITLLLSACAGPGASYFGATPAPTITTQPSVTIAVSPTPQPSPTALLQPTSITDYNPEPTADSNATPEPSKTLLEAYLPNAKVIAETDHFVFYAQDGYFPVDQQWWLKQSESIYEYVSDRVNAQAKNKIHIAFIKPETRSCPVRGLASPDNPPTVLLYADAKSPRDYLLGVLAHELGHAIPAEGFPEGLPDNIALTEGLATWASGKYWARWKAVASLDELIRQYIRSGEYEPIHENTDLHGVYPWQNGTGSSEDCLARRDKVYSEWGDFLGYLIDTYGWNKAHRLFQAPEPKRQGDKLITFPIDYEGVYGKSLNQLEWEWLQYLSMNNRAASLPDYSSNF